MDGFFYYGRKTSHSKLLPAFDNYYGTPVTHKEKWLTTMFSKEEIVIYDTFKEMAEAETLLIRPNLNSPLCLNECCGGFLSLDKITQIGKDNVELKRGWFALTTEDRKEIGSKSGKICKEKKTGIFGMTEEERKELGKRNGQRCKETKTGVCGLSPERRKEITNEVVKNRLGFLGRTSEQHKEDAKKASLQKWVNTHPEFEPYVSTAAGLSHWQRARDIPVSYREKLKIQ